ncbi:glycosyltransferase family 61 protein [Salipiger sp. P9]|uniref:glycosyltransferase family 61 protein n=1 Tax=Salipiger pentaromativorans TaxID=2943193 RepID=UPI0021570A30|nr:glycosyltransferase family 61 protein [Salipiger pentaromativorans]MCR8550890.1 glycosyltransferase family 61 protein [Salipiger pentaromativorans]
MTWSLSMECGGRSRDETGTAQPIWSVPEYNFPTLPTTNMSGVGPQIGRIRRGAQDLRLYRLQDVYVGTCGVIYDRFGRIFLPHLAPFITPELRNLRNFAYVLHNYGITLLSDEGDVQMNGTPFEATRSIEEPVFIASSYWERAYTHFFLELLPSILHYRKRVDPDIKLLLSDSIAASRKGFLDMLGLNDRVATKETDEIVFVRELWLTDYPRLCGPENAELLLEAFAPQFDPAVRNTEPPVYIARHDAFAWDRRLLNEEELLCRLPEHGIEVFVPTGLPLDQQLDKLWRSRLVIGMYGGAVFNLLLGMREKHSLLLCSENYNRYDYDGLSPFFEHRSAKLLCRSFESRRDANNSPIFVNPEAFWALVEKLN